jgi:hypothetical protein
LSVTPWGAFPFSMIFKRTENLVGSQTLGAWRFSEVTSGKAQK